MSTYELLKTTIDSGVEPSTAHAKLLKDNVLDEINRAENNRCPDAELSLGRSLYLLYKLYFFPPNYSGEILEMSPILFEIRSNLERYLQRVADRRIPESVLSNIPENNADFVDYIMDCIHNHPSYKHYIYEEFIPNICSLEQLQYYFLQEITMDVNTDDFLAVLQVGCERISKTEIAHNYWDEMGHGNINKMHGLLFEGIFDYMGISPDIELEEITVEALMCGNLQIFVSLYRQLFAYGAGFFYPCEYMASGRFEKAISAWNRLELPQEGLRYHKLHVPLDIIHAKNWMSKVVEPYIEIHPHQKKQLLSGVFYRLDSSLRYLNMLQSNWNLQSKNNQVA